MSVIRTIFLLFLGPLLCTFGLLAFLGGCAFPSHQLLTMRAMSSKDSLQASQDLKTSLMVHATQASLINYKDYIVGSEDLLTINFFGHDNLNREVRVNGQGEITLPLVGVVKVSGLTPQGIEKLLQELYDADYLVNPQISVSVKEFRHQRVAVTGAVEKPGYYEIIGPRTLLEVLAMAGGFSNKPDMLAGDTLSLIRHQNAPDLVNKDKIGNVQPFDPKTETIVIDLRRLVSGQAPELNLIVKNGDVVHVPFASTAYVLGGVRRPGNIKVKDNLTVSQAVAMAGGVEPILGTYNITIMRFNEQGKPISIKTNLKNIIERYDQDIPVKENDVIVVQESKLKKSLFIMRTLLPIPTGHFSLTSM